MSDAMRAETVEIDGFGGDSIEAYLAQPFDRASTGGVVVIHHMPGYDGATNEITRRFAAHGYLAICPNLYWRDAPGADPDDAAATARAKGGVPDERLVGDVAGAVSFLRSIPSSNGKVATIGYCSGGRQSVLAACTLDVDAAVDCYGAFVLAEPPEGASITVRSIGHLLGDLSCPLLGLFGAEDKFPSAEEVSDLEKILGESGKVAEFHTYDGAGHAFFAVDRPSYRPEAANQGWREIWDFFGRHLSAGT